MPICLLMVLCVQDAAGAGTASAAAATVYDVTVGADITAATDGQRVTAGVVVPAEWPEQEVEPLDRQATACKAYVRAVGDGGAMLLMRTERLRRGQTASVRYRYRVTVRPVAGVWEAGDFPAAQPRPGRELRDFLRPTEGIESTDRTVRLLARELTEGIDDDWAKARVFFDWVHDEIEYREQDFTGARAAVRSRVGDCEEKASTFIALCRASGIPARTVWSPGHCWAEFHLIDDSGNGHWIPAHTAGNRWFAELPSRKLIWQKGDRFTIPESNQRNKRLLNPWYSSTRPSPKVEWVQQVVPQTHAKNRVPDGVPDRP